MAAGLTDHVWSIKEIVNLIAKQQASGESNNDLIQETTYQLTSENTKLATRS